MSDAWFETLTGSLIERFCVPILNYRASTETALILGGVLLAVWWVRTKRRPITSTVAVAGPPVVAHLLNLHAGMILSIMSIALCTISGSRLSKEARQTRLGAIISILTVIYAAGHLTVREISFSQKTVIILLAVVGSILVTGTVAWRWWTAPPVDPVRQVDEETRQSVFNSDHRRCVYCGASGSNVELHADHIIPHTKGGRSTPGNMQTLCRECNLAKSAKSDTDARKEYKDRTGRDPISDPRQGELTMSRSAQKLQRPDENTNKTGR